MVEIHFMIDVITPLLAGIALHTGGVLGTGVTRLDYISFIEH